MHVQNPRSLAVVFLRSGSGRSVRELATGPLPADLDAYRPPREAVETVRREFESRGFEVIPDAQGLTLTLKGLRAQFADLFDVPEADLELMTGDTPLELEPPEQIRDLVETVTLLRQPAFGTAEADTVATPAHDLTGTTVGRFTITGRVGVGGMGEVYRAEDTQLKRTVAIKRLAPGLRDGRVPDDELLREARRASALNHPRIAAIYDVFAVGHERFLVMEYVDGTTLRERLESAVSVSDFCDIAIQCTEALAAAHQRGILHGDLKPTNIMLTREGAVKVCDFGLARRLPQAAGSGDTTRTGRRIVAGTPGYMAPEVVMEQPLDVRVDIFSLGVVFYEMLSGRNPFQADTLIATIDRIRTVSPEPLDRVNPDVPPRLARLVGRMIEKDPAKRCASALDVGSELAAVKAALPAARRRLRLRGPKTLWIALAAALVLTAAIVPRLRDRTASTDARSALPDEINLVVLPFRSAGQGGDRQFFTQGLTETLNQKLSTLTVNRPFQVATVADVRARKVTDRTEAREQLGANVVLTGSLDYAGELVRITCQLLDARSGRPLRAETVTADASNPIAVQDRVVQAAVGMMGLDLGPEERNALAAHDTQQPGAYDFYLQGRGYLLNYDRIENLDHAIAVFRQALAVDSRYALAYAGLGQAYWRKHELTGAAVWVEPARASCEGALGINPKLAEAHACLGLVLNGTGQYEKAAEVFGTALGLEPTSDLSYVGLATAYEKLRRPEDAERTYRRAIQLRPHYWAAYNTLGAYYYRLGRFDDALAMFQQVVALAPDNFRGHSSLGAVLFMKDRPQEAIASFQKSMSIRPNHVAASNLGTLYFFEGDYRRSADAFRQALSLEEGNYQVWGNLAGALESAGRSGESAAAYRRARALVLERIGVDPRDPALHMAVADHHAALGDTAAARASLATVRKLAPADAHTLFQLAVFLEHRLGQRDEALASLAKAIERGQTWREIDRSPFLIELRKDPRFQQLRTGNARQ